MFQKYQNTKNKPKTIQAVQFTEENKDRIFNSLSGQFAPDFENGKPIIKVTTIHGDIAIVRIGDWIVKEDRIGFYYPVIDKIFKTNYIKHKEETI